MHDDILDRYPNVRGRPRAMASLCITLRDRGQLDDALALGMAAMAGAPEDMRVRDTVRSALSKDVPHFHAPMLRDVPRNQVYREAIERAVRPGMHVLEIGTGSGLLALIAARAGAWVTTCEDNPMVAAAARAIVARNGLSDRIRIITKRSQDLHVGADLAEPADLLVSELFSDALFGEGVIGALSDAREHLMKPGAPVLPPRAELRCALAAVDRLPSEALTAVEGFDLSPFALLARPNDRAVSSVRANAQARSHSVSALAMDFEQASPFGPADQKLTLESLGGRVDAVAQWLRIDFGDGLVFENEPFTGPESHWRAPLYELPAPIETSPGDRFALELRHSRTQLTIHARPL